MFNKIKLLSILLLVGCFLPVLAQKTLIYQEPGQKYRSAIELFDKEKYGAARQKFDDFIDNAEDKQSEMVVNANYYAAVCALNLYNDDAEYLLIKFIKNHPENANAKRAYFLIAKFQFHKKKYYSAIGSFKQIDPYELNENEKMEYYFKKGYSYFITKDFAKAKIDFYEIKEKESEFAVPANYYYGHSNYKEGNYETALLSFEKLVNDPSFGPIVPYYITQIYYLQEKYEKLLKIAPALLEHASTKRAAEISRIIGEAYYKTSKFKEAIPYLERYMKSTKNKVTQKDAYQLGFAYYKSGDYKNAITKFQIAVPEKYDSLSQNAYYHIGACYLKLGNKNFARNSFLLAHLPYDKEIQKNALFNYSKLSYELGYNPYNETINAFEKYIRYYPEDETIDEANQYLADLYLTTKNYKGALASIEKIKKKNIQLKMAYQVIAYYRGIELFNDKKYQKAISVLNKSIKNNYNNTLLSNSYYWKAESFYRLSAFDSASYNYKTFLMSPGAFSLPYYSRSHYNLGYSYFKQKEYPSSIKSFRKYVNTYSQRDSNVLNDTYLRLGDCYFISKKYKRAVDYYDKAIEINGDDKDYAYFQKGLSLGVTGRMEKKVDVLLELLKEFPASTYADDSKFELANICLSLNDNEKAFMYFKKVVDEYPNSSYYTKSMLKMGSILYNQGKDAEAMTTFKKLVADFPATPAAKEALVNIKNISVTTDSVKEYIEYIKDIPFAEISESEEDSAMYIAIENSYMDGGCERIYGRFEQYLKEFPNGMFVVNANFYKSECLFSKGDLEIALEGYKHVATAPKSKFTESALVQSAHINFELKNYKEAIVYYERLEKEAEYKSNIINALIGQMRAAFIINDEEKTINAAKKIFVADKVGDEFIQEAHLKYGITAIGMDSLELAIKELDAANMTIINNLSAEAKYNLAVIKFIQEKYDESEKYIFDLINQVPSYDYWVAKGFILLSDNYLEGGNIFQAKHTLQSIIDNYTGDDGILNLAKSKINTIIELQEAEEKKKEEERLQAIKLEEEEAKKQLEANDTIPQIEKEKSMKIDFIEEEQDVEETPKITNDTIK